MILYVVVLIYLHTHILCIWWLVKMLSYSFVEKHVVLCEPFHVWSAQVCNCSCENTQSLSLSLNFRINSKSCQNCFHAFLLHMFLEEPSAISCFSLDVSSFWFFLSGIQQVLMVVSVSSVSGASMFTANCIRLSEDDMKHNTSWHVLTYLYTGC